MVLSLQYAAVQTYVSKRVAKYLSTALQTEITIDAVYFKPFNTLELTNIQINDRSGKKMLYAHSIQANISFVKLFDQKIEVKALRLQAPYVNYEVFKDSTNFTFLIDYFKSEPKKEKSSNKGLQIDLKKLEVQQAHLKFLDHRYKRHQRGIDFGDIDLSELSGTFDEIEFEGSVFKSKISQLTFKEKTGLYVRNFSANTSVSGKEMEFSNLMLQTNRSHLTHYVALRYPNFDAFEDFISRVKVEGRLENSLIDSKDIEFFAPDMKFVRFSTEVLKADLNGTVEHIRAKNVHLKTGNVTSLRADFTIDGLPDIQKTVFNFSVDELATSAKDVEKLVPELGNMQQFTLPEELQYFEQVHYAGKLTGYYYDFKALGNLQTALGAISTESAINIASKVTFSGTANSAQFDLGSLLKSKDLSTTGLSVTFSGNTNNTKSVDLKATGEASNLKFKEYTYAKINFDGEILEKVLRANGQFIDPNAQLFFDGVADWSTTAPRYKLYANIDQLSLKKTKLYQQDSIVIKETDVEADLNGESLNSIAGYVKSDKLTFSSSRGEFTVGKLAFESSGSEHYKSLLLTSDVVQASMSGQIHLQTIGAYFKSLAMRYAPAINIPTQAYDPQNFDLQVKVTSFAPISSLFDPSLKMDNGATLKAHFSSQNYTAKFEAFSPIMSYKGITVKNLSLKEDADNKAFDLRILADRISLSDSVYIDHIRINNTLANDSLRFAIQLSDSNRPNHLALSGNIHFAYERPAYIKFDQSNLVLNNELWTINPNADLRVSKGKFYLNNLLFKRDKQEVAVNGILSDENDKVNIAFKDFNLASFSGITKPLGINLQGHLNGDIIVNSLFKNPNLSAHINTSPIVYNNLPIGTLVVNADYAPQKGVVELVAKLLSIDGKGVEMYGYYDLNAEENPLLLQGKLKDTDLLIVQPFLKDLITNLYGKLSGEVEISGSLNKPVFQGHATISDASFLVNYLQTNYNMLNQGIVIDNNRLILNNLRFQDSRNVPALASGFVDMNTLSDPNIQLQVTTNNLHVLNTTRKDNELFFGTAFASGKFSFKGPSSAINISIDAESKPNTSITIPFNSSLTVTENDFIYFTTADSSTAGNKKTERLFKGLTMNMDLNISPETEINLENNLGSLKGAGRGNLSLRISSLGDFEMFGDYHVLSGKFHFTAQDFFNKYFDLKEGGTIRWAGNPSDASVNLGATYQQRTSVAPLYNAAGRSENNSRVLAQADMILKGTLSQPELSFDLNFPQDPYIKDELQSYFIDGNNINQQAISLIVRRSFTPASTQEFGKELNNTLLSAGTEIAFNQLNSIISQSLKMDFFDLNIRSFNDASASLKFFDDRLTLTGGVSDRSKNRVNDLTPFSDQIATDAEVTFKLRKDGSLVLRAYNRLNTKNFLFTPYSDYISAAGLVYRQEFNTLPEFWRKLWWWSDKKDKKDTLKVDSLTIPNPPLLKTN